MHQKVFGTICTTGLEIGFWLMLFGTFTLMLEITYRNELKHTIGSSMSESRFNDLAALPTESDTVISISIVEVIRIFVKNKFRRTA